MEPTTRKILICVVISFFLAVSSNPPLIRHSKQNVASNMDTTASSTDNYAGCKKKDCKEAKAFVSYVVDGAIYTCFRSLAENKPWLMVKLKDYHPIFWVRTMTSEKISLERVKIFVGDINTRASREHFTLCAFKEKIEKNRWMSFGCNELYVYGNAVKISSESSHSILSLCEVEVYADAYGNILSEFTESLIQKGSAYRAHDQIRFTCFKTVKQDPWWSLELGANVRVSMVLIITSDYEQGLEGVDILVGKDGRKETDLCTTIPKYDHVANYFECKKPVVGSFLNITWAREPRGQFALCEVEVFQTNITNLAARRPTRSKTNNLFSSFGCDQSIAVVVSTKQWWAVDLVAICQVHLVRVVTDVNYKPDDLVDLVVKVDIGPKVLHEQNSIASLYDGFGKGNVVASLNYPTKESVQTITLPKDTKARYVTLDLIKENRDLNFREVEVYNGPLLELDECKKPDICPQNYRCEKRLNSHSCKCDGGYRLTGSGKECKDIDECSSNSKLCHENASCTNTVGSYKCACNHGYFGDGQTYCFPLKSCSDDEDCESNQFCNDTKGINLCDCIKGHHFEAKKCVDKDECVDKNICGSHSVCRNLLGSFACNCFGGFKSKNGDGKHCYDTDECSGKKEPACGGKAKCENTLGSFQCICPKGFGYDEAEKNCYDIDECAVSGSCGLNMDCVNSAGSYTCSCSSGYRGNKTSCIDIDECEEETHSCTKFSRCKNKNGGYDCPCRDGFEKTAQGTCSEICIRTCDENSYCQNGVCLCRSGFSMGFGFKCQPNEGLLGSGMSLQSPAILIMTALLWRLALI